MLQTSNKLALVVIALTVLLQLPGHTLTSSTSATTDSSTGTESTTASTTPTPTPTTTAAATTASATTTAGPTAAPTTTAGGGGGASTTTVAPGVTSTVSTSGSTTSSSGAGGSTASFTASSTASTTSTTPAPAVCINQNCTGNLTCLDTSDAGDTCLLGSGQCYQVVISNSTYSMVYTGCSATCDAVVFTGGEDYEEDKRCCNTNRCNGDVINPRNSAITSSKITGNLFVCLLLLAMIFR